MHTITVRLSDTEIATIDALAKQNGNHSRTAEATQLLRAGLHAEAREDRLVAAVSAAIDAAFRKKSDGRMKHENGSISVL